MFFYVSGICQWKISSEKIPVMRHKEDRRVCTLTRNFSATELSFKNEITLSICIAKHLFKDHKIAKKILIRELIF